MKQTETCNCRHLNPETAAHIRAVMPAEDALYDLADFFKIFADSTRIKMLYTLSYSEMCVCDLAEMLSMNQSAISHQLRTLKQMNLVRNRREGKTIFYSLADDHIKAILNQGMEHIEE
ncbi:MAG: metalloregulator ArsR/SmtB family transcription factor [Lachnospiraceae bacterium]|nr:metalloregulator ArsR/SmtB family transcription factor [Lachnospiraceae bacterium]